jgi:hypothetical protein
MKKLILPILAASLLAGCNILEKEPLPSIAPSTFFKSASDAEAGITGAYDALQATGIYSQDLIVMGEMPSDNCTSNNNDVRRMEELTWNSTTSQVINLYRDSYVGVNRANVVLKYVPGIEMPATRRTQILGEAHFLRALNYFNLVKAYGGVPLRLEPTESASPAILNLPRASAEEVYTQIVADLTEAAATMPQRNDKRAGRDAALTLLAKVQLYRRQWQAALDAANQAIANGNYSLAGNFASLFPADNNPESIFEIQNSGSADGNNILPDLLLPSPPATYSFDKFNIPTGELIGYADTLNDLRWKYVGNTAAGRNHVSFTMKRSSNNAENGFFVYKWPGPPNSFNSPDNTYVLRYAETLLIQAEAANEQSGPAAALASLNLIRQRAGLAQLSASSAEAASKQAMRNEIDRQRRLELAFEGERWFDLVRYAQHELADPAADHPVTALDIIASRQNGNRNQNYLVFPIPLGELNTNSNVEQNTGY